MIDHVLKVEPDSFNSEDHWYEKAGNAQIHPMVQHFLNMPNELIASRYSHLHPRVESKDLLELLNSSAKYFPWSGTDLINVTSAGGKRQMVVIENNSCPSGQKSMPLTHDWEEQGGYRVLIEKAFKHFLKNRRIGSGDLAVIYDKNHMEASGYAAAMADAFKENVFLVPCTEFTEGKLFRFENGKLEVKYNEAWRPIRAAFRYVTQRPWAVIPIHSKTAIFNPIISCLSGGRNKLVASKAYEFYNFSLEELGLNINTPVTKVDVSKEEVPLWVEQFGGHAVVKIPYSNAGQGVYTITHPQELEDFMNIEFNYEKFIVQSLIGDYHWSSETAKGKLYHVGTVPDKKKNIYVCDIRMMICSGAGGFRPLAIYSRRARKPLKQKVVSGQSSWDILGTNLSVKEGDYKWHSETSRLLLMDRKDFNSLGLGIDDLIEGYIQSVLGTIAIDEMAKKLVNKKGKFSMKLFNSLNDDKSLSSEILMN